MTRLSLSHRVQWLPIAIAAVCTAALTLLLLTGVRLAARLQSASSALQLASALSSQPQLLRAELTLIQRGLETRTYVGNSLRALAAARAASNDSYSHLASALSKSGLARRADIAALYARAVTGWRPTEAGLASLEKTKTTDLYADSASGSSLTPRGAALKHSVDELLAAQARNNAALATDLGDLAARLREAVVHDGQSLRGLLLGGAGLASLLLATMLYFAWRAARAETRLDLLLVALVVQQQQAVQHLAPRRLADGVAQPLLGLVEAMSRSQVVPAVGGATASSISRASRAAWRYRLLSRCGSWKRL